MMADTDIAQAVADAGERRLVREIPDVVDRVRDGIRTVTVQLVRWLDPRDVIDVDGSRYREQFAIDSLELDDDVHVTDRHFGTLIGRALPETYRATPDGAVVDVIVSADHTVGGDTLALVESGVIRAVSMEVDPVDEISRDGIVTRTRAIVRGIAFAFRPQLAAPVVAVRETPNPGEEPMNTHPDTPALPDVRPIDVPDAVTAETLARSLDDLRAELATGLDTVRPSVHPATRYRSLGEYALARTERGGEAPSGDLIVRALEDQVPADNPGVLPPAWLRSVAGMVNRGRPVITAFGSMEAPRGMVVNWPYWDGDDSAIVAPQSAPKQPINSVKISFPVENASKVTYAVGGDLAYQLIRESDPSFRELFLNRCLNGYSVTTDLAAVTAAAAAAVDSGNTIDATTTPEDLNGIMVSASVDVEHATGLPAEFIVASSDVVKALGYLLPPANYGTVNVAGTVDARRLGMVISGLPVVHAPFAADGTLFVSNSTAAVWMGNGPYTVAAENVEQLGQDVAVYGFGVMAVMVAAGIVSITYTPPAT